MGNVFVFSPTDELFWENAIAYHGDKPCWGWLLDGGLDNQNIRNMWIFVGPPHLGKYSFTTHRNYMNMYSQTIGRFVWEHQDFFAVLAEALNIDVRFVQGDYLYPIIIQKVNRNNYWFAHYHRVLWENSPYETLDKLDHKLTHEENYSLYTEQAINHVFMGGLGNAAFGPKICHYYINNAYKSGVLDAMYSIECARTIEYSIEERKHTKSDSPFYLSQQYVEAYLENAFPECKCPGPQCKRTITINNARRSTANDYLRYFRQALDTYRRYYYF